VLVVDRNHVSEVRKRLAACQEPCYEIGTIVSGNQSVIYG
jgi:hypothetical protein